MLRLSINASNAFYEARFAGQKLQITFRPLIESTITRTQQMLTTMFLGAMQRDRNKKQCLMGAINT
jgi:hypothetical protein